LETASSSFVTVPSSIYVWARSKTRERRKWDCKKGKEGKNKNID